MDGQPEALIDLGAIKDNVGALARHVGGAQVMAVVKSDGYGHGLLPAATAALDGGATWLGVVHVADALALRRAGADRAGAVPARRAGRAARGRHPPRRRPVRRIGRAGRPDRGRGGAGRTPGPAAPEGGHRDGAGRRDRGRLAAAGGGGAGRPRRPGRSASSGSGRTSPAPTCPGHPSIAAQLEAFRDALSLAERAGARPEVRHLANTPATLTLPGCLVRPGPAGRRGVRAVHAPRRRAGLAAPRDDRAGHGWSRSSGSRPAPGCPTGTAT